MPEMVRAVIETKAAMGLSLAQAFERICRQHRIDGDNKIELEHSVMEFLRMVR